MTRRAASRGDQDRRKPRQRMMLLGTISACGDVARLRQPIRIRDLSATGLMAVSDTAYDAGILVDVEMRGLPPVRGEIAWVEGKSFGVTFALPINPLLARQPLAKSLPPRLAAATKPLRRPGFRVD